MDYIEITVSVSPICPFADLLKDDLANIGFESFMDQPMGFSAYIPKGDFQEKLFEETLQEFRSEYQAAITYEKKVIPDQNWNAVWESNYAPVLIDDFCYVHASFHSPMENIPYNIEIHPAMSFGTAHHATTYLMVEFLHNENLKGKSVMDMGCGTGILAIFAAKCGADYVEAIDIDEHAFNNCLDNVQSNNVSDIVIKHGNVAETSKRQFDVYVANIHRNILIQDMADYVGHLAPNGVLLMSGFFESDIPTIDIIAKKYGLTLTDTKVRNKWAAVRYIKQPIR